jgi:hypothetical protein
MSTNTAVSSSPVHAYDDDLSREVLAPYRPGCKYLQSVEVELPGEGAAFLRARARFSIPYSCYIVDTGHFNAVEYNICYNQLAYYAIAKCVKEGVPGIFETWDMETYRKKQLPDMLIVGFQSTFKRPIDAKNFYCELEFLSSKLSKNILFLETSCRFTDNGSGLAYGNTTLAFLNALVRPC